MFYEKINNGFILRVRVTPNSSKCAVSGIFTDSDGRDYLKINLNAVPEKGKANQELIKFLSKLLKQSKSAFTLISGETDRYKKLSLTTTNTKEIEQILQQLEENNDGKNS
ncbi:MAG: DUF167 domain-containing protein [Acetobacter sp.]|nr:DUF167 domain-containing protein [Acetobacter sp.]